MRRYLELANRALIEFECKEPLVRLTIDPYAERMRAMLAEISRPSYPAGMILWLEHAQPDLYSELTEWLPNLIHRLWEAHAPLGEFEETLSRLVAEQRRACALYRAYVANQHGQASMP